MLASSIRQVAKKIGNSGVKFPLNFDFLSLGQEQK